MHARPGNRRSNRAGVLLYFAPRTITSALARIIVKRKLTPGPRPARTADRGPCDFLYQTLHMGTFTIGWPALQPKAAANCGMFATMPLIRAKPGE